MANRIGFLAMIIAAFMVLTAGKVQALSVQLEVKTSGAPLPDAGISLEMEDGKKITLKKTAIAQKCEIRESRKTKEDRESEPNTGSMDTDEDRAQGPSTGDGQPVQTKPKQAGKKPKSFQIQTNDCGMIKVEIDDGLKGKPVYVVIRHEGKIVQRKKMDLTGDFVKLSISVAPFDFAISVSQPEICRIGADCKFAIKIENKAKTAYNGPVFVMDRMPVSVSLGPIRGGTWFCEPAGRRGEVLCVIAAEHLKQEEKLALDLSLKMRSNPYGRNTKKCVEILWPRLDAPLGEDRLTVQLLQLGANMKGFNIGKIDGVMGGRTLSVFEDLLESAQLNTEDMSVAALITALKWDGMLSPLNSLKPSEQCAEIKFDKTAKRRGRPRSTTPGRIMRNLGIGIGIGLGR